MDEARTRSLAEHLERAITMVALEAPLHFAATRRQLGELTGLLRVGDEPPMSVCLAAGPPWVRRKDGGQIELSLSEATLARILDGDLTIDEGILNGQLSARGELDHLMAFFDGLASWLHGALRSPSLPGLHERLVAERSRVSDESDKKKGLRTC